mmetsp:Transcript_55280/g.131832  ORF Transcript_55280/g.131832 Transcript_55280/m.131832 type:complete len:534 (+) Transcript_55280:100-1701(+)
MAMDLSWKTLVTESYDILWKMIIRPPRSQYAVSELGYQKFRFQDKAYCRQDEQVVNDKGLKLECSHYYPLDSKTSGHPREKLPCVVYLHGNCSSRLEAVDSLRVLLPRGVSVFCLDLAGSGLSEGEYISLGYYEEQDLKVVIKHLKASGRVSSIGLWGRSMGAATSILRASQDSTLAACVLDSPFSSLRVVAEELVNSGIVSVPDFLLNMALQNVREEIQKRANFDIEELVPLKKAPLARAPAIFAVAKDDDFVLPHHTERLYKVWGCSPQDKKLVTFGGGHNGPRPQWFLDEAATFLVDRLRRHAENPESIPGAGGIALQAEYQADVDSEFVIVPPPSSPQKAALNEVKTVKGAAPVAPAPAAASSSRNGSAPGKPAAQQSKSLSDVEKQLIAMGFGADMAAAASKRHKSVEAAVHWILEESTQIVQKSAKALGTVQLRAPSAASPGTLGEPQQRGQVQASQQPAGVQPPNIGSSQAARPGATSSTGRVEKMAPQILLQHLLDFGFPFGQASEAAQRCGTVEEAVDYIAKHN